ncbi:MAG: DUF2179 domain-containing protein [Candidatus Cloacimonetes bacterium]|jgi:uncharacterized protein YebE (UPF0316 family)|nr:DUF2179 domain-containing protein [Candidatus Cloacimonadota bacterium]
MLDFIPHESLIYVLPILIFLSRIFDVTLGTLRIIFVNRGMRHLAPIIGFFEILIWLIVISQIMQNINSPINYIAYAAGFATGNYVGILIEQKLAIGITLIRIITRKKASELLLDFRSKGYSVINVPAVANSGDVEIIFLPARRKDINQIIETVKLYNPNALYTIEDVRYLSHGALPSATYESKNWSKPWNRLFRYKRKSK